MSEFDFQEFKKIWEEIIEKIENSEIIDESYEKMLIGNFLFYKWLRRIFAKSEKELFELELLEARLVAALAGPTSRYKLLKKEIDAEKWRSLKEISRTIEELLEKLRLKFPLPQS